MKIIFYEFFDWYLIILSQKKFACLGTKFWSYEKLAFETPPLFFKFWVISALKIHFVSISLFFRFVHTVWCYVKGVGAPDGELDIYELYTFFSVVSIMVALALRIYVNTASNYPEITGALPSDNSTSSMLLCLEFSYAAAKLTGIGQLAFINENLAWL